MDMNVLRQTASLAKLDIQGQEEAMLREFAAMAVYGAGLGVAMDTVPAPERKAAVLRSDAPGESLLKEKALMNAPDTDGEFIVAPRAFD